MQFHLETCHLPKVQQQPNSSDCGLFVIAHAVEFCFNPKIYIAKQTFRKHLTVCLENKQFQPFPKEYSRLRNIKMDINKNMKTTEISCRCGMPDFVK